MKTIQLESADLSKFYGKGTVHEKCTLTVMAPSIIIAAGSEWERYLKGTLILEGGQSVDAYCHPTETLQIELKAKFPSNRKLPDSNIEVTGESFEATESLGVSIYNCFFSV